MYIFYTVEVLKLQHIQNAKRSRDCSVLHWANDDPPLIRLRRLPFVVALLFVVVNTSLQAAKCNCCAAAAFLSVGSSSVKSVILDMVLWIAKVHCNLPITVTPLEGRLLFTTKILWRYPLNPLISPVKIFRKDMWRHEGGRFYCRRLLGMHFKITFKVVGKYRWLFIAGTSLALDRWPLATCFDLWATQFRILLPVVLAWIGHQSLGTHF